MSEKSKILQVFRDGNIAILGIEPEISNYKFSPFLAVRSHCDRVYNTWGLKT